jgi:preprotein translocase subunit SecF
VSVADIIGKRKWFYLFSLAIVIPGLIFIILTPLTDGKVGLQFGVDYTGGTIWVMKFADQNPSPAAVKEVLVQQGLPDSTVTKRSDGYLELRMPPIGLNQVQPAPSSPVPGSSVTPAPSASSGASASPAGSAAPTATPLPTPSPSPSANPATANVPTTGKFGEVATALEASFGPVGSTQQITTIGPVITKELIQDAIILILLGSLGILLWVSIRFHDFKFGVSAIVALLHDVIVVVGIFAILGTLFHVQIDALFVTAMLTVIGFSVHDTIVVFDRIRENRQRHAGEPFDAIVNHSILQTLGRSINTSMTVVITLTALLLFGAAAIQDFVLALLIGIISGTYSSIFVASPIVVDWHLWEDRRRQRSMALARAAR